MKVLNLKNSKKILTKEIFISQIASKLNFSQKSDYLILSKKNYDSESFFMSLKEKLISDNPYVNFIHLKDKKKMNKNFPFFIQIFGDYITKRTTLVKILLESLSFLEMIKFFLFFILLIFFGQAFSTLLVKFQRKELFSIQIDDFFQIHGFVAYALTFILSLITPVIVGFLWKKFGSASKKNNIQSKLNDNVIEMLAARNQRIHLRLFRSRFIRNSGPIIIVIDSIDEYNSPFDQDFFAHLNEFLKQFSGPSCLLNISYKLNCHRINLLNSSKQLETVQFIFTENSIRSKDIDNFHSLGADEFSIIQDFCKINPDGYLNNKTLLQFILINPKLSLYGFQPNMIDQHIISLEPILRKIDSTYFDIKSLFGNIEKQFVDCMNTSMKSYIYSLPFNESYSVDSEFKDMIIADIKNEIKCLFISIHFIDITKRFINKENVFHTELIDIIDLLLCSTSDIYKLKIENVLHNSVSNLLVSLEGSIYAELNEKAGCLYILTKGNDSTLTQSDLLSLQAIIMYHNFGQCEVVNLIESLDANNIKNPFYDILSVLLSNDNEILFKHLSFDSKNENISSQLAIFYRWLYLEKFRQFEGVPTIIDYKINHKEYVSDFDIQSPSTAGGFNFSSLQALFNLFEFNYLCKENEFIDTVKTIARGVSVIKTSPSVDYYRIDDFWSQLITVCTIVEYVEYISYNGNKSTLSENFPKHSIGGEDLVLELNKLLKLLNTNQKIEYNTFINTAFLDSLNFYLNNLIVNSIILELKGFQMLLSFYQLRLKILFKSIFTNSKKDLLELYTTMIEEIEFCPIARQNFILEKYLLNFRAYSDVHRDLSYPILEKIVNILEINGCLDVLLDSITWGFIDILRFSENYQNNKIAINLMLKVHKKIKTYQKKYGILEQVNFYLLLSSELIKINKKLFAKLVYMKANHLLISYSGERTTEYYSQEINAYCESLHFNEVAREEVLDKIELFLLDEKYHDCDFSFRGRIILMAIRYDIYMDYRFNKILQNLNVNNHWYTGYFYSYAINLLYCKIRDNGKFDENIDTFIVLFEKLTKSDQSQILLDDLLDDIPYLLHKMDNSDNLDFKSDLSEYFQILSMRKLNIIFIEATLSMSNDGNLTNIIDAYFRLFGNQLYCLLPKDISKILINEISNESDIIELRTTYKNLLNQEKFLWIRIFIAKSIISYAVSKQNKILESEFRQDYKYFGYEYIKSMLNSILEIPFISDTIKNLVIVHLGKYNEKLA